MAEGEVVGLMGSSSSAPQGVQGLGLNSIVLSFVRLCPFLSFSVCSSSVCANFIVLSAGFGAMQSTRICVEVRPKVKSLLNMPTCGFSIVVFCDT